MGEYVTSWAPARKVTYKARVGEAAAIQHSMAVLRGRQRGYESIGDVVHAARVQRAIDRLCRRMLALLPVAYGVAVGAKR